MESRLSMIHPQSRLRHHLVLRPPQALDLVQVGEAGVEADALAPALALARGPVLQLAVDSFHTRN